jgi:hypothetical protein
LGISLLPLLKKRYEGDLGSWARYIGYGSLAFVAFATFTLTILCRGDRDYLQKTVPHEFGLLFVLFLIYCWPVCLAFLIGYRRALYEGLFGVRRMDGKLKRETKLALIGIIVGLIIWIAFISIFMPCLQHKLREEIIVFYENLMAEPIQEYNRIRAEIQKDKEVPLSPYGDLSKYFKLLESPKSELLTPPDWLRYKNDPNGLYIKPRDSGGIFYHPIPGGITIKVTSNSDYMTGAIGYIRNEGESIETFSLNKLYRTHNPGMLMVFMREEKPLQTTDSIRCQVLKGNEITDDWYKNHVNPIEVTENYVLQNLTFGTVIKNFPWPKKGLAPRRLGTAYFVLSPFVFWGLGVVLTFAFIYSLPFCYAVYLKHKQKKGPEQKEEPEIILPEESPFENSSKSSSEVTPLATTDRKPPAPLQPKPPTSPQSKSDENFVKSYLDRLLERADAESQIRLLQKRIELYNISKEAFEAWYNERVAEGKVSRVENEQEHERLLLEKAKRDAEEALKRIDLEVEKEKKKLQAEIAEYEVKIAEAEAQKESAKKGVAKSEEKPLSPGEKEQREMDSIISTIKAEGDVLEKLIQAMNEDLGKIDKEAYPEMYEARRNKWMQKIMELMEK